MSGHHVPAVRMTRVFIESCAVLHRYESWSSTRGPVAPARAYSIGAPTSTSSKAVPATTRAQGARPGAVLRAAWPSALCGRRTLPRTPAPSCRRGRVLLRQRSSEMSTQPRLSRRARTRTMAAACSEPRLRSWAAWRAHPRQYAVHVPWDYIRRRATPSRRSCRRRHVTLSSNCHLLPLQ